MPLQHWKRNDVEDLRRKLADTDPNCPKLVAFESVYSMDGDICPLKEVLDVCDEYGAMSYLDEVHAVGLYGPHGGGIAQQEGLSDRVTIIQGTLGKAFGVVGGYIASSENLIDYVRSFASGFIFSTALPPAVSAGATESIRHLRHSNVEREKQRYNVNLLREKLDAASIPHLLNKSHIVPVMVNDAHNCNFLSDVLLNEYGIYVQPINYPTVPIGTERLRITPSPLHTEKDIDYLVETLSRLWSKCLYPVKVYKAI